MQVSGVIISSYLLRNTLDVLTAKHKGLCQKNSKIEEVEGEAGKRDTAEVGENTQYIYILVKQLPF